MISFALVIVSLKTVAIAALVGFVVCWILHHAHRRWCKDGQGCCSKSGMSGQKCEGYPSLDKHDECCNNCSVPCMAVYKVIAYALEFVQAYGIAYLIERFDLFGNYQDAIWLTLFVAVAFWVVKKAKCVMWHSKSWSHFACKVAGHLIVLASMAATIIYLS